MQCMEKLMERQADLKNEQINATRTSKMEPESNKLLQRTSKKGPMSQQWRHLANRRHPRRQKMPQRGPTEGPNGAPDADWRRTASKHGSNMGPRKYQKRVQMLNNLKMELPLQREPSSAHERTPQMEPENWVAHGNHKNEARGVLRRPT